jgi:hypothetical protein
MYLEQDLRDGYDALDPTYFVELSIREAYISQSQAVWF